VDESDQAVQSGWAPSFDDSVLHKLIDRVLADNFDLKATAARIKTAMAQVQNVLNVFREVEQALAAEEWPRTQETQLRAAVQQTETS